MKNGQEKRREEGRETVVRVQPEDSKALELMEGPVSISVCKNSS